MEELLGGAAGDAGDCAVADGVEMRGRIGGRNWLHLRVWMRRHAVRVFAEGETPPANMVGYAAAREGRRADVQYFPRGGRLWLLQRARAWQKHGNRAGEFFERFSGCAEALGVRIDLPFWRREKRFAALELIFVLPSSAHGRRVTRRPARKQIGVRTVFNYWGR